MSATELQELEEVKGLIARGQQVGVLTYAEIEAATAELGLDETDVEELHGLLERAEIELVEEVDPSRSRRRTWNATRTSVVGASPRRRLTSSPT